MEANICCKYFANICCRENVENSWEGRPCWKWHMVRLSRYNVRYVQQTYICVIYNLCKRTFVQCAMRVNIHLYTECKHTLLQCAIRANILLEVSLLGTQIYQSVHCTLHYNHTLSELTPYYISGLNALKARIQSLQVFHTLTMTGNKS